jgi:hypothetical protein
MELLRFLEEFSPQKLVNVFTGDESWPYLDSPRDSIWLASEVPRPRRANMNIGPRKVMIWICFPRSRSYHAGMLPPGERSNRNFFLDEAFERHDEHRSETIKQNSSYGIFLHIVSAHPHLVQSKFDSMRIHRIPHYP